MATARAEDEHGHSVRPHLVTESSKSIWYLLLLTLSIGG